MCAVPAAVPSGEHLIRITVDFRPVFAPFVMEERQRIEAPPAGALERLLGKLQHRTPDGRRRAAAELGAFPGQGALALPALLELTRDDNEKVRIAAIRAIAKYPEMASNSVPRLLEILAAGTPDDGWAAYMLGKMGVSTPEVIAALRAAAKAEDEVLREDATAALTALGAD